MYMILHLIYIYIYIYIYYSILRMSITTSGHEPFIYFFFSRLAVFGLFLIFCWRCSCILNVTLGSVCTRNTLHNQDISVLFLHLECDHCEYVELAWHCLNRCTCTCMCVPRMWFVMLCILNVTTANMSNLRDNKCSKLAWTVWTCVCSRRGSNSNFIHTCAHVASVNFCVCHHMLQLVCN
jgi:hypothetical protein